MITVHTPEQRQAFAELKAEIRQLAAHQRRYRELARQHSHTPELARLRDKALWEFCRPLGDISRQRMSTLLDFRRRVVGKEPCHGGYLVDDDYRAAYPAWVCLLSPATETV